MVARPFELMHRDTRTAASRAGAPPKSISHRYHGPQNTTFWLSRWCSNRSRSDCPSERFLGKEAGHVGRPLDCVANGLACQAELRRASHMRLRRGCASEADRRALYALSWPAEMKAKVAKCVEVHKRKWTTRPLQTVAIRFAKSISTS
jgi:hypothetical protein